MLVTKREIKQRLLLLDRTERVKELLYTGKSLSLGIGQGSQVASLAGANSVENTQFGAFCWKVAGRLFLHSI